MLRYNLIGDTEVQVEGLRIDWITDERWKYDWAPIPTYLLDTDMERAIRVGEREVARTRTAIVGYTITPQTHTVIR
jgi:hypothetical protein